MINIAKYFKIPYITLFVVIIWDPLRAYILQFSGSGYIYLLLVSIGIIHEMKYKHFWKDLMKPPFIIWFLWITYTLINTFFIKGFNSQTSSISFIFVLFLPLFVLLVISNSRYNTQSLNKILIFSFTIRLIFSLVFDSFAAMGKDDISRLGEIFNANSIALGAFFLIVLILFQKIAIKKLSHINYLQLILALYIVMATSSRKTAIAIFIILLGFVYINRSKNLAKRYLKYALTIILLLISGIYILNNTSIGHRLTSTYYTTINANSPETMFDSRMGQYIQGYNQFIDNPITGVGLYNFGHIGPVKITAHSEYIVQFAECGLIGVLLSLLFYRYIFRGLVKRKKISELDKKISEYFIFFLLASFFLMFGAWVYNLAIYWIIIGIIIKYLRHNRTEIN